MTFDNFVNAKEEVANNKDQEAIAVKVSYGDDIRRITFAGSSFASLREEAAKLYSLNSSSVVLKYLDDDGDKITMSTDAELQDAIHNSKVLRLYVVVPLGPMGQYPCGAMGDHHHGPMSIHHHGPMGLHHQGPMGHFAPMGPFHGPAGHWSPAPGSPAPTSGTPVARQYCVHCVFAQGDFSPAPITEPAPLGEFSPAQIPDPAPSGELDDLTPLNPLAVKTDADPDCDMKKADDVPPAPAPAPAVTAPAPAVAAPEPPLDRNAIKERKQAIKATLQELKNKERTPEVKQEIREFKEKMRAEMKQLKVQRRPSDAELVPKGDCDVERNAFKERKQAMRATLQTMKENATTEDDKLAINQFKENMKAELKIKKGMRKYQQKRNVTASNISQ